MHVVRHLSKFMECTTLRVNPDVTYGLWEIVMCWSIQCSVQCFPTCMEGLYFNPRGNYGLFALFLKEKEKADVEEITEVPSMTARMAQILEWPCYTMGWGGGVGGSWEHSDNSFRKQKSYVHQIFISLFGILNSRGTCIFTVFHFFHLWHR